MSEAPTPAAKPAKPPKPPTIPGPALTLGQQRFRLALVALGALMGSIAGLGLVPDKYQTAAITIIGTALVGPVKDAFRHFFPGGKPDADHPAN